ncbi:MAG: hypothetical protein WAT09_13600 [Paracoccaceae bacterium]
MALLLWVQDFANWVWPLIRLTMLVLAPPEADISPEDQAVLATLA